MTSQDQDFPWMFHRDEIDLLEDELEDLYDRFHKEKEIVRSFESTVLAEQIDTEESSDNRLSERLGMDISEELFSSFTSLRQSDQPPSVSGAWQKEEKSLNSHPLYQLARAWLAHVKPRAKAGYEGGHGYAQEFFRVYANCNFVPLKVFTAISEETHEDQMGYEIAEEEYRLALLYIERILESLSLMAFDREMFEWLESSRTKAQELHNEIQKHLEMLIRRKNSLS